MPYEVRKTDACPASRPWGVIKVGGKVMGCHATKAAAEAQRRAIIANEEDASMTATLSRLTRALRPGEFRLLDPSTREALTAGAALPEGEIPFEALIILEGLPTGDGRFIMPGALTWRDLPVPLMALPTATHGGLDPGPSFQVGRFNVIERRDTELWGIGVFMDEWAARDIAQRVADGFLTGISADLDDLVVQFDEDTELLVATQARIMGATIVPFPAFQEAHISIPQAALVPDIVVPIGQDADGQPTVAIAAAATVAVRSEAPPRHVFAAPDVDRPTPLVWANTGRVFGHLAAWGTCHTAHAECIVAPRSAHSYAYFHTGEDPWGLGLPVGRLTVGTTHADIRLNHAAAAQHYEDTGATVAVVQAGEDAYGIWLAGAVVPWATAAQLGQARACPPSGDWRRIAGGLELVGALCVNVPGFPVPRLLASGLPGRVAAAGNVESYYSGNVVTALVAAGRLLLEGPEDTLQCMADRIDQLERTVAALSSALGPTAAAALAARIGR
jgi:hypothetical protein